MNIKSVLRRVSQEGRRAEAGWWRCWRIQQSCETTSRDADLFFMHTDSLHYFSSTWESAVDSHTRALRLLWYFPFLFFSCAVFTEACCWIPYSLLMHEGQLFTSHPCGERRDGDSKEGGVLSSVQQRNKRRKTAPLTWGLNLREQRNEKKMGDVHVGIFHEAPQEFPSDTLMLHC